MSTFQENNRACALNSFPWPTSAALFARETSSLAPIPRHRWQARSRGTSLRRGVFKKKHKILVRSRGTRLSHHQLLWLWTFPAR
jgi:hypothetical protein